MPSIAYAPDVFARLVFYHHALESEPAQAMKLFITAVRNSAGLEEAYLQLVRRLYQEPTSLRLLPDAWQSHLIGQLLSAENAFSRAAAAGSLLPELKEAAAHDLRLLQYLFGLTGANCRALVPGPSLPTWPGWPEHVGPDMATGAARAMATRMAAATDWSSLVEPLAAYYRTAGTGATGFSWFLRWEGGKLKGVEQPAYFDLDDLVGLVEAKSVVLRNTEQFLAGEPANNLLLYGPRGTGKSTMVRSLITRFGTAGLRLIEVERSRLTALPELFRAVQRLPQRFIAFLDDLSFDETDADFKGFKSAIEGALEARPENLLLYATSNRRHLVPEKWSDRHTPETAEVHGQDAMEEKLSLADRFGLTVLFTAPDQEHYLSIVEAMARQRGIALPADELRALALRWILWNNARSGRSARQFVDDLAGRLGTNPNNQDGV